MSGFVFCVAVQNARILQAASKFVSFVAGEKCRYGDVCLLFVLLWKVHVFCRQLRSFDHYVALESVCVPRVMAKFVFHRKCTYAKFVLCVAMETARVLPAVVKFEWYC